MTRRILSALVGLTVLLLAGVVVPLGAFSAAHDRQVFSDRSVAAAAALASAAEEQLADREQGRPSPGVLAYSPALVGQDATAIYDGTGRRVQRVGDLVPATAADVAAALAGNTVHRWVEVPRDALLVLRPAYSGTRVVGASAILRDSRPLTGQIRRLWLGLAAAGLTAVLLATGLGLALARWVGRPLRHLDATADQLGAGDLAVRAATGLGPPEIRALATTFNDMAGRLEALVGSHRAFVADISHQLRTPLAAMRLRLELLHDDVDAAAAEELSGALGEISRLSRLVDGLLAVARAEHSISAPVDVDLVHLVAERISTWAPLAAERRITLEARGPVTAPVASTPGHLEQVLDNLLANALDVTPAGGQVSVTVSRRRDSIRLEVLDTGPGMTENQRTHAFRRFWTDPAETTPHDNMGGSGLGLAIVHRLVTVDGGEITVHNVPGSGLAVRIDLHASRGRQRELTMLGERTRGD